MASREDQIMQPIQVEAASAQEALTELGFAAFAEGLAVDCLLSGRLAVSAVCFSISMALGADSLKSLRYLHRSRATSE